MTEDIYALLEKVSTATLCSIMLARGFRNVTMTQLKPLRPDLRLVGHALTLRYVPAREDVGISVHFDNHTNIQRLAVESIRSRDVLVIDARGEDATGTLGAILATRIWRRGGAGIVTDGPVRDVASFREIEIPVYSLGASPGLSSALHFPADMNVPISCGGVLVNPGDVLVGDSDGVVVVPNAIVEEIATAAGEQEEREGFILERVRQGAPIVDLYPMASRYEPEYREWLLRRSSQSDGANLSADPKTEVQRRDNGATAGDR